MPLCQRPNQKEQSRIFLQTLGHVKILPTSHIAEGLPGETPDGPCWPLLWPRLSYFFEIYTPLSGNFEAQEQGCLNQGTTILQICIEHLHDVLGSSYHIKKDFLLFVNGPAESQDIATHFLEHRLMSSWRMAWGTPGRSLASTVISIFRGELFDSEGGLDEVFHQPLDAWEEGTRPEWDLHAYLEWQKKAFRIVVSWDRKSVV